MMAVRPTVTNGPWWPAATLLACLGALLGGTETWAVSITGDLFPAMDATRFIVGLFAVAAALAVANRFPALPWDRPGFAVVLAVLGCLVAGWLGGVAWVNSGDEYCNLFLADTFRAGRLWDPPSPDPVLFASHCILVKDGRTFVAYPPGWPALLVPFRAFGATWLANPLLTAALGVALDGIGRRMNLARTVRTPALALVLLVPYTLFLGGSLFPQTLAAALVAAIVWMQLTDEARPEGGRKLLIGAAFGALLLTRYDVFAVTAVVYAVDRMSIRRLHAFADGLVVLTGVAPFAVGLLAYDAAITGNPLQVTSSWASAGAFDDSIKFGFSLTAMLAVATNIYRLGTLAEFGGLLVLVLAAIALVAKIRQRTCRFYDFLMPAAIVFYSLVAFTGGHQYGPRYWFWAWPIAVFTITSGAVDACGYLHLSGRRIAFERLATAWLAYAAGAFCMLLVTTHMYIRARQVVYAVPPPETPAVVLLPTRFIRAWPWQLDDRLSVASRLEFTRNDIDFDGPVLYGRDNLPDSTTRACRLAGRAVFRWREPGALARVTCPSDATTTPTPGGP
jgi:hypothetical protein